MAPLVELQKYLFSAVAVLLAVPHRRVFSRPGWDRGIKNDLVVHLNHAGASPSPTAVIDRVYEHLLLEQTLGGYAAAKVVEEELRRVYMLTAELVCVHDHEDTWSSPRTDGSDTIALVESATVAWTRLFYAFVSSLQEQEKKSTVPQKSPKVILVSEAEYAANVVAASRWATTHPDWTVLAIPTKLDAKGASTGKIDTDVLQAMLDGDYVYKGTVKLNPSRIKLVCVTHVPTNSGVINPVQDVGQLIAAFNEKFQNPSYRLPSILYLVDACQSVGQLPVDVNRIQCHGLVATGRKYLRAPRGTGFLYIAHNVCQYVWPHHIDHYGVPVSEVPQQTWSVGTPVEDVLQFAPRQGASRFEFWESNVAGKLGLGKAIEHALTVGSSQITDSIVNDLVPYLYQRLRTMPHVHLYCPPECGIVTFWVDGKDSVDVQRALWHFDEDGKRFEVSVVPATSTPLDSARTKAPNLVRVSLSYTTTTQELDLFVDRLSRLFVTDEA